MILKMANFYLSFTICWVLFLALQILFNPYNDSVKYILFLSPLTLRNIKIRKVKWIVSAYYQQQGEPGFDLGPPDSVA